MGKGAFGTVFRAELQGAEGFSRPVALKVLHREGGTTTDMGARLRDEARMLGMIRHRAVVQVESLVALDDRWTIVMEYIEGTDLGRLPRGLIPPGAALEILSEVASALHVAQTTEHGGRPLGLLHRDLKPSNILLTRNGEVKVVDFGGARADFEGRKAQTSNMTFGSPGYMAPERLVGEDTPAGDVYALGVLLYELVSGRPFGETKARPSSHREVVEKALAEARLRPELDSLIRELVAFDPRTRPSARELETRARDLRQVMGGPYLRDWAEEHVVVPPLLETGHDFSTTVLFERPSASGDAAATFDVGDEVFVDVLDTFMPVEDDDEVVRRPRADGATRLNRLPPRVPRAEGPSLWRRVVLVLVVLGVMVPAAFAAGIVLVLLGVGVAQLV